MSNERFNYVRQSLAPLLESVLRENIADLEPRYQLSVQLRENSPNAKVKLTANRNFAISLVPTARQTVLERVMSVLLPFVKSSIFHAKSCREVVGEIDLSSLDNRELLVGNFISTFSWLISLKSGFPITEVRPPSVDILDKTCDFVKECVSSNFLNESYDNYDVGLSMYIRNGTFSSYRVKKSQVELPSEQQNIETYWQQLMENLFEDRISGQVELLANLNPQNIQNYEHTFFQETRLLEKYEQSRSKINSTGKVHKLVR